MNLKFLLVVISLLLCLFYFKLNQMTRATAFFKLLNNGKNQTYSKEVTNKLSPQLSTSNNMDSTVSRIKTFINLTRGGQMELENFFKFKELQYNESRQRIT